MIISDELRNTSGRGIRCADKSAKVVT